jgi:hypothetical protein
MRPSRELGSALPGLLRADGLGLQLQRLPGSSRTAKVVGDDGSMVFTRIPYLGREARGIVFPMT